MSLSSSTRKMAVDALFAKLKEQIDQRVAVSEAAGSARSSWSLMEELKNDDAWTGDKFGPDDEKRRVGILASYRIKLETLKKEEDDTWAAIQDLLKAS